jgi:hypothetical protein
MGPSMSFPMSRVFMARLRRRYIALLYTFVFLLFLARPSSRTVGVRVDGLYITGWELDGCSTRLANFTVFSGTFRNETRIVYATD